MIGFWIGVGNWFASGIGVGFTFGILGPSIRIDSFTELATKRVWKTKEHKCDDKQKWKFIGCSKNNRDKENKHSLQFSHLTCTITSEIKAAKNKSSLLSLYPLERRNLFYCDIIEMPSTKKNIYLFHSRMFPSFSQQKLVTKSLLPLPCQKCKEWCNIFLVATKFFYWLLLN